METSIRITRRTERAGRTHEESIELDFRQLYPNAARAPMPAAPETIPVNFGWVTSPGAPFDPAWTKVLADGTHVPASDPRTDHVAVIDHAAGLMWVVESLGDPENPGDGISQERCIDRCNTLRLLGYDDWRLPTRTELAGRIDDTRRAPAIDTNLFPRVLPRWHWTSTVLVNEDGTASASVAWFVYFGNGNVGDNHRSNGGFALAVRRVGQ